MRICALSMVVLVVAMGARHLVAQTQPASGQTHFQWPNGKRAAVSLTFDDSRLSQIDAGLAVLRKQGVKATFYAQAPGVEKRLEGWKQAVAEGHEIGNHTVTHPCTGNYPFSRNNALEDYDLNALERLCEYLKDPANGIWLDTVEQVGTYVRDHQPSFAPKH